MATRPIGALVALVVVAACGSPVSNVASGARTEATPTPTATASGVVGSPRLDRPSLAYDAARQQMLLFGTNFGLVSAASARTTQAETWAWHNGAWHQLLPTATPPARTLAGMAGDDAHGQVVLFGGQAATPPAGQKGLPALGDTWTWDGTNWKEQRPPTNPPAAVGPLLAYDAKLGKVIAVVDVAESATQTWAWDGANWTRLQLPQDPPGPRANQALAYSEQDGTLFLYGRLVCIGPLGCTEDPDMWIFDGSTWTRRQANATWLEGHSEAAMAFAGQFLNYGGDGMIVVGGRRGGAVVDQIGWWDPGAAGLYNYTFTRGTPEPRAMARAGYDRADNSIVIYGGEWSTQNASLTYYDTWIYASRLFSQVQPTTAPAPSSMRSAIIQAATRTCPSRGVCSTGVKGDPMLGENAAYAVFDNPPGMCVAYVYWNSTVESWQPVSIACGPNGAPIPMVLSDVVVNVDTCANVRIAPEFGQVVQCLTNGTKVTIDDGPVGLSNNPKRLWWHIHFPYSQHERGGWIFQDLIVSRF